MKIKFLIYKIREDLKRLFFYPDTDLKNGYEVDYDKYWKERGRKNSSTLSDWQRQRAEYLIDMIESGDTILDIGCGDGALLKYVKEHKDVRAIGVDLDIPILKQAEQSGLKIIAMDVTNFDELKRLPNVDYVVGFEIIEHMSNPEKFISIVYPKIKKGMIFSFPNTGYYLHRLRLLFGSFPLQWIIHPGEHLRYWTVRDVKKWTKMLDLPLEKLILYEGLPIFNKIWPSLFGQGIIVKLGKRK